MCGGRATPRACQLAADTMAANEVKLFGKWSFEDVEVRGGSGAAPACARLRALARRAAGSARPAAGRVGVGMGAARARELGGGWKARARGRAGGARPRPSGGVRTGGVDGKGPTHAPARGAAWRGARALGARARAGVRAGVLRRRKMRRRLSNAFDRTAYQSARARAGARSTLPLSPSLGLADAPRGGDEGVCA